MGITNRLLSAICLNKIMIKSCYKGILLLFFAINCFAFKIIESNNSKVLISLGLGNSYSVFGLRLSFEYKDIVGVDYTMNPYFGFKTYSITVRKLFHSISPLPNDGVSIKISPGISYGRRHHPSWSEVLNFNERFINIVGCLRVDFPKYVSLNFQSGVEFNLKYRKPYDDNYEHGKEYGHKDGYKRDVWPVLGGGIGLVFPLKGNVMKKE